MSIIEKPKSYASHGKEFATRKDAEKHSALFAAREELENAQRKFQRLLAENAITADGHPFEFGVFNDYYQVFKPYNSLPYLVTYCYLCWSWSVREPTDRPEIVEIRDESKASEPDGMGRWCPIRELYRSGDAANKALVAARREWLAEKTAEVEAMESKASD